MHQNTSFDGSTTKFDQFSLVIKGIEVEKKREKVKITGFQPPHPDDPLHPIVTKLVEVSGMVDVSNCANFEVDRLRGARSVG